jgi:hypothetical protein
MNQFKIKIKTQFKGLITPLKFPIDKDSLKVSVAQISKLFIF